jgi:hypothetical protein
VTSNHLLVWGLAILLAGCTSPRPGGGSTTSASHPASSSALAPEEGTPYDPETWTEPVPPLAAKISATVSGEWKLHVVGSPGALPRAEKVLVADIGSGRAAIVDAKPDGSFAADLVGGPGAWVQVARLPATLPQAPSFNLKLSAFQHLVGSVYVRAADPSMPAPPQGGQAFSITGHTLTNVVWALAGTVEDGPDAVRLHATLKVSSARDRAQFNFVTRLVRYFDGLGEPMPAGGEFATSYLTSSGLPLERLTLGRNPTATPFAGCPVHRDTPLTLACTLDASVPTNGIPPGGYALHFAVNVDPVYPDEQGGEDRMPSDGLITGARQYDAGVFGTYGAMSPLALEGMPLAFLTRGMSGQPRLATLLLADTPAQAARGLQADGDHWGWSNHIAWQPFLHVTPRTDATGEPIRYLLEPYLPQLMVTDRETPAPPPMELALPGGTWKVTITDPTGASSILGPAPFKQLVSRAASAVGDMPLNQGGDQVMGIAHLTTLDDQFRHAFTKDGLHQIRIEGDVPDAHGHSFRLTGTFRLLVAEPLDLDLGMLPGTPIAVGQSVDRSVQLHPPVPAQITYRFREWTGPQAALTLDVLTTGTASRYGWFHPHPGQPLQPTQPGEYRVDVAANYTDLSGHLWSATWTFGGVVADPATQLEVHGRRGDDTMHQDKARYKRSETGLLSNTGSHLNFPYYNGDVAWQTDDDAMYVRVTVADPSGTVAGLFTSRAANVTNLDPVGTNGMQGQGPADGADVVAPRFASGQGPLFSSTASGLNPSFGAPLDRFGYFSATVEKPGVRVRETWREDNLHRAYWRFGQDTYTLQPNVGPEGDAPNDYKFLFGGAVVRATDQAVLKTGGYASLWIDIPATDGTGSRIDSPFNPAASPLLVRNSKSIRAFFDPTGTRAGSLLEVGDMADFGGYVAPLGPNKVRIDVTSPSGKARHLEGIANSWGHLHDPTMNFVVDEPGVWTVKVGLHACPPARDASFPCQDGGLNDGSDTYDFYVATPGKTIGGLALPKFLRPEAPLRIAMAQGAAGAHVTTWMPGWLLDDHDVKAGEPLIDYDPHALWQKFPNFEQTGFQRGVPARQVTFTAAVPSPDGTWAGFAFDAWAGRVLAIGPS